EECQPPLLLHRVPEPGEDGGLSKAGESGLTAASSGPGAQTCRLVEGIRFTRKNLHAAINVPYSRVIPGDAPDAATRRRQAAQGDPQAQRRSGQDASRRREVTG